MKKGESKMQCQVATVKPNRIQAKSNEILCQCYLDGDGKPFHDYYRDFEAFSRHTEQLRAMFPGTISRGSLFSVRASKSLLAKLVEGCGIVEGNFDYDDPKPGEICNY